AVAPISTGSSGVVVVNGQATINVTGTPAGPGTFPLISYGGADLTAGQFAGLRLGTNLSGAGLLFGLSNNSAAKTIDLALENVNPSVTWTGAVNGTWDSATANWTPGNFASGNQLVFNHSGANTTITGAAVNPQAITVNNSAVNYTINNPINGNLLGGLAKSGAGTLQLTGNNTFTGPINVTGGTLRAPAGPATSGLGSG